MPFQNNSLLPIGPPDALPSDYVEFDFSDVFGSAPCQASTQNLVVGSAASGSLYEDPAVICSRSHSLVGPSSHVSHPLKLSKLTLCDTEEDILELTNPVIGEPRGDLTEPPTAVGLEDFEVLRLVGRGGFGKVYQVRRTGTSEIYAMKVVRKDEIMEKNNAGYLKSERDILTKVDHPFIVQLRYSFQVIK